MMKKVFPFLAKGMISILSTRAIAFLAAFLLLASCNAPLPDDIAKAYKTLPKELDFNLHVKPILSDRCFSCHGPDKGKLKAGLRLDKPESAFGELPESPGKRAITPGSLRNSELYKRIISTDTGYVMPQPSSHLELTAYEKAVLVKWIEEGAHYKPHWAFIKPVKTDPPVVQNRSWVKNPIDNFILSRLEKEHLAPSPEADKEILLRRVSLDLTGLPPTIAEIDSFLADHSPNAYEKQVDRLLASPHYGERMAVDWLDVARFADSHGYTVDRLRDMSPWRDWVIKSFNENQPYDDFITWQLAGDLLPHPTRDQLIATAFNRNNQENMEGGIVEEEFRVEYVVDRTNTTGEAFMGLTVGCAKCHDHKFDPISQKEYYQLTSYFNNLKEAGQISWDNAMPVPTMLLTGKDKEQLLAFMKKQEEAKEKELQSQQTDPVTEKNFRGWLDREDYRKDAAKKFPEGLAAWFPLADTFMRNTLKPKERGVMMREGNSKEAAVMGVSERGPCLQFGGDSWLDLGKTGSQYTRSTPFTVGVWVKIPSALKSGVIFHRGLSTLLYNYRGFHLAVEDHKLELEMAHTAPYDAIIKYTKDDVPRDRWVQLTATYDGSSTAAGFKVYLNGNEMQTNTDQDNLYKDIIFSDTSMHPPLQFGAWERGKGLTGGAANDITVFNRALTPLEVMQLAGQPVYKQVFEKPAGRLSAEEIAGLRDYYLANYSIPYKQTLAVLQAIRTRCNDSVEKIPELMIMQDMPVPRPTYILDRGVYDAHKQQVFPGVPETILPMPKDFPHNRLGLAKWLTLPDHPLTARVAVNRYWQLYFGRGLVKTAEDFGNQGAMPSHPALLDWLAVNFRESGWNVKALQRLIVTSATYRQRSNQEGPSVAADPENILLARGPSGRLTAEMLRDNALSASGLLNPKIGGPSVNPYQPDGLWKINLADYKQDSGSALYRRGLYTVWKRSVPNPTQATFDAGIRTSCIVGRQKTNTPLQALVILNDPTYLEAAKVMGEQITKAADTRSATVRVFRELTGRRPTGDELSLLLELRDKEYRKFKSDKNKTKGWLNAGAYKTDRSGDPALLAADAVLASTILNMDASISKR